VGRGGGQDNGHRATSARSTRAAARRGALNVLVPRALPERERRATSRDERAAVGDREDGGGENSAAAQYRSEHRTKRCNSEGGGHTVSSARCNPDSCFVRAVSWIQHALNHPQNSHPRHLLLAGSAPLARLDLRGGGCANLVRARFAHGRPSVAALILDRRHAQHVTWLVVMCCRPTRGSHLALLFVCIEQ
jgi:hypothetical protein